MKSESILQISNWISVVFGIVFFLILGMIAFRQMVIDYRNLKKGMSVIGIGRLSLSIIIVAGTLFVSKYGAWDTPYRIVKSDSQIAFEYVLRKSKRFDITDIEKLNFRMQRFPTCLLITFDSETIYLSVKGKVEAEKIMSFIASP